MSFDFDIDALLAAETDEEDENLPDLERSLDDILDDAWEEEQAAQLGQLQSKTELEKDKDTGPISQEVALNKKQAESRLNHVFLENSKRLLPALVSISHGTGKSATFMHSESGVTSKIIQGPDGSDSSEERMPDIKYLEVHSGPAVSSSTAAQNRVTSYCVNAEVDILEKQSRTASILNEPYDANNGTLPSTIADVGPSHVDTTLNEDNTCTLQGKEHHVADMKKSSSGDLPPSTLGASENVVDVAASSSRCQAEKGKQSDNSREGERTESGVLDTAVDVAKPVKADKGKGKNTFWEGTTTARLLKNSKFAAGLWKGSSLAFLGASVDGASTSRASASSRIEGCQNEDGSKQKAHSNNGVWENEELGSGEHRGDALSPGGGSPRSIASSIESTASFMSLGRISTASWATLALGQPAGKASTIKSSRVGLRPGAAFAAAEAAAAAAAQRRSAGSGWLGSSSYTGTTSPGDTRLGAEHSHPNSLSSSSLSLEDAHCVDDSTSISVYPSAQLPPHLDSAAQRIPSPFNGVQSHIAKSPTALATFARTGSSPALLECTDGEGGSSQEPGFDRPFHVFEAQQTDQVVSSGGPTSSQLLGLVEEPRNTLEKLPSRGDTGDASELREKTKPIQQLLDAKPLLLLVEPVHSMPLEASLTKLDTTVQAEFNNETEEVLRIEHTFVDSKTSKPTSPILHNEGKCSEIEVLNLEQGHATDVVDECMGDYDGDWEDLEGLESLPVMEDVQDKSLEGTERNAADVYDQLSTRGEKRHRDQEADKALEEEQSGNKWKRRADNERLAALEHAVEVERRKASSGLTWEEGAAAQPMRLEGIQRGPPAIGLLQLDTVASLSAALANPALKRDHGAPLALAIHSNFIAVGMSKGGILVAPSRYSPNRSADNTEDKAFLLGGTATSSAGSATAIDFNQQGDLLLAGYSSGAVTLWDVTRGAVAKAIVGEHSQTIVHCRFVGQDQLTSRSTRTLTADARGVVLLHSFTVLPLLRRYSVTTQCLLDGSRGGPVLSIAPALAEDNFTPVGTGTASSGGGAQAMPGGLGGVMGGALGGMGGMVGAGMDAGKKLLDGSLQEDASLPVALITNSMALLVRLVPSLEVLARFDRPVRSGGLSAPLDGSIPYAAWRRMRSRSLSNLQHSISLPVPLISASSRVSAQTAPNGALGNKGQGDASAGASLQGHENSNNHDRGSSTGALLSGKAGVTEASLTRHSSEADIAEAVPKAPVQAGGLRNAVLEDVEEEKLLALAWDCRVQVLQLLKTDVKVVQEWQLDAPANGVAWIAEQMLVVLNAKDQLCLFDLSGSEIERVGLEVAGDSLVSHSNFTDGVKAFHNSIAVRGAAVYCLGSRVLRRARLLPWHERIKALQEAGDWMGAFRIAMDLFDGRAEGVTGLPCGLEAMRAAIMPALLQLLSAYIDEAFAYVHLAIGSDPNRSTAIGSNQAHVVDFASTANEAHLNGATEMGFQNDTESAGSEPTLSFGNGVKHEQVQNGSGKRGLAKRHVDDGLGSLKNEMPKQHVFSGAVDKEGWRKDSNVEKVETAVNRNGTAVLADDAMVVAAKEQYARVGGVAVEFCVHLNQTTVLFGDVFRKFDAVGQRGTFLELLEPYILKDMLPGLAPEMMQALVEHYSARGWLQRVEHCVLHMDIASLDFNQVVHLCRDHELYSALIYLFTRGLDDFVSPLEELLAVARDFDSPHGREVGYKLLVYLQHCFAGLYFPPGHGRLPESKLASVQHKVLGYILERTGRPRFIGPCGTFPRLRSLLALDTAATLSVLSSAFPNDSSLDPHRQSTEGQIVGMEQVGIAALEAEAKKGHEMTTEECQDGEDKEAEGKRLLSLLVAAIVEVYEGSIVLDVGKDAERSKGVVAKVVAGNGNYAEQPLGDVKAGLGLVSPQDAALLLDFIAEHTAAGHASLQRTMFICILEYLAEGQPRGVGKGMGNGTGDAASLGLEAHQTGPASPPQVTQASNRRRREQLMLALLESAQEDTWDFVTVAKLARNAQFWQVSAFLHTKQGPPHLASALDCLLQDKGSPQEPFSFIWRMLGNQTYFQGNAAALKSFRSAVLQRLPDLIGISSEAALRLIGEHFGADCEHIVQELTLQPELQFAFLKAIHHSALERQAILSAGAGAPARNPNVPGGGMSIASPTVEQGRSEMGAGNVADVRLKVFGIQEPLMTGKDSLVNSSVSMKLELTDTMAELYIELLCRFEPHAVLPFLQSHEKYRLEHCLALCVLHKITDAAAFLLERMGKVADALLLVLASLEAKIRSMDIAIARKLLNRLDVKKINFSDKLSENQAKVPEVAAVQGVVDMAVAFCQRNTQQLQQREAEALWFQLMDGLVSPIREVKKEAAQRRAKLQERRKQAVGTQDLGRSVQNERSTALANHTSSSGERRWQSSRSRKTAEEMRHVLVELLVTVMEGMSGHVPLPAVLAQLVERNAQDECADFKGLLLSLLGGLTFECSVLGTVKRLIEADMFSKVEVLRKGRAAGIAARSMSCCACGQKFNFEKTDLNSRETRHSGREQGDDSSGDSQETVTGRDGGLLSGLQVWSCGHVAHRACRRIREKSEGHDGEVRHCPLCRQFATTGWRIVGNELKEHERDDAGEQLTTDGRGVGPDGHNEVAKKSQRESQLQSASSAKHRLARLSSLQRGRGVRLADSASKLHLAPPRGPSRSQILTAQGAFRGREGPNGEERFVGSKSETVQKKEPRSPAALLLPPTHQQGTSVKRTL